VPRSNRIVGGGGFRPVDVGEVVAGRVLPEWGIPA